MNGPLEEKLEQLARREGWRLRWKSEPLSSAPSLTCTELDLFAGKRLLTRSPVWLMHSSQVDAREDIAGVVIGHHMRYSGNSNRAGGRAAPMLRGNA